MDAAVSFDLDQFALVKISERCAYVVGKRVGVNVVSFR
jgi:hypothetical protein